MPTPTSPMEPPNPDPQRARATRRLNRKSVPRWARRLLLVPAAALVLIGAPALAIDQPSSSNPAPQAEQVPVAAPSQTVGAGYEKQVPVNSADLVGVKWKGDPNAQFTVEARDAAGNWQTVRDVGARRHRCRRGIARRAQGRRERARPRPIPSRSTARATSGSPSRAAP